MALLAIFSGLPGAGKTAIARELARQIGAMYLRIDSIEQAIRTSSPDGEPMDDAGYRIAYAVAEDNLRLGRTVVADSVNPLRITRDAWRGVAERAGAAAVEIEIRCSEVDEHRRRIASRTSDVDGLKLAWEDVLARTYEPWDCEHVVIETSDTTVEENIRLLRAAIMEKHQ